MKLTPQELSQVMQRAKAGESEAFSILYEAFYTPIFRFILSKVQDREQAEDILQTTFLKAFKAKDNWPEEMKAPMAYFYTIARNLITDYYRKQKEVLIEESANEEGGDSFWNRIKDIELDPHHELVEKNKSNFLKDSLSQLPENYRQVMWMKFIEEKSNQEISETLGKTEMNIRQIQVRALKKLRSQFEANSLTI